MSDSEDEPQLSVQALAALQEFYQEEKDRTEQEEAALASGDVEHFTPGENWQLSQFWYDDKTADTLAREALAAVGHHGRIACVSSPTAYRRLRELKPDTVTAKCLEYDPRFEVYGEDFVLYDYNEPLKLDPALRGGFDLVIADPPFLTEDCLTKTAVTIKFLTQGTQGKIILCTGAVMSDLASRLMQVSSCQFRPMHSNKLENEFRCYANYDSTLLNS